MDNMATMQPTEYLEKKTKEALEAANFVHSKGHKVYESLKHASEHIGTEYGDRVLYELIQNAHDAHESGYKKGQISIKLVIRSNDDGELYIANGGNGFQKKDVDSITNLAISSKTIGEGIGNKGLGFRSIEALTDDVKIFSQKGKGKKNSRKFDGYCFGFSNTSEIKSLLRDINMTIDDTVIEEVANTISQYLVPKPLKDQPENITSYAKNGYATVIVLPLRTTEAVTLARTQAQMLVDLEVPILLFLDRIAEIRIDIESPNEKPISRRLRRRQEDLGNMSRISDRDCKLYEVNVGSGQRFLLARGYLDKDQVLKAVKKSIQQAPQLKRWLDWEGEPQVSVAVGLSSSAVTDGRLYNFLPMGEAAKSPLIGHINAPFFTHIDRRDANLNLPLNEIFVMAAAEICAATALFIVENKMPISSQVVFDLFAWTGEHARELDKALEELNSSLCDAPVIPIISGRGGRKWGSLSQVSIWPEGHFAVLKDKEVAKRIGIQLVLSEELGDRRMKRLKEVAKRADLPLIPSDEQLADWLEKFAHSLLNRRASAQTWSGFYNDIFQIFEAFKKGLKLLGGREFLLDRHGKLIPAGSTNENENISVYVRGDTPKGKRKKSGMPLPPSTLTRRYLFLHERITLKRQALDAFMEAGLVRKYDPIEALSGLKSTFKTKATDKQRKEALIWAFQVWHTANGSVDEELLREAELYVPTLSGWKLATDTMFSSSWTSVGKILEEYLITAAEVSADCQRSYNLILVGQQEWPISVQDAKRIWTEFLAVIGVTDGLKPIPAKIPHEGRPGDFWDNLLRQGKSEEGLDENWCAEVANISFSHPRTDYQTEGCAWRLPGQIEYDSFPKSTKENLCALIFEHLKNDGTSYFQFEIGRFNRSYREYDKKVLQTPLAIFLRTNAWIAANTCQEIKFRSPSECWSSRTRSGKPPRFIDRVPEEMAIYLSEDSTFSKLVFSETLGLRDWKNQDTAIERLFELAKIITRLGSNDRLTAQNEYRRAWNDVVETDSQIPPDIQLIVTKHGRYEVLEGTQENPSSFIISENSQRFEARLLSRAGQPILDVGSTQTDRIAKLLEETGSFSPRLLESSTIQLLVDGELFMSSADDPLLISMGLEWLPDVIAIGNQILGEQLELGIQSSTIIRRVRSIRIRRCKSIKLVVDDNLVNPGDHIEYYAIDDEDLPTLILTESISLDLKTLALNSFSRLIDRRLRSASPLISRIALYQDSDILEYPSDKILAQVLECDVETIKEHRAALLTDIEHILFLLHPVVAHYGSIDLSHKLKHDSDRDGSKFDLREWLHNYWNDSTYGPEGLIELCEKSANRSELRKHMGIDYHKFNQILQELGEPILSNEEELRRLYNGFLAQQRSHIIDRLRQHYITDFREGNDLTSYVERKSLGFLPFNTEWVLERETLDMDLVKSHISRLLDDELGEDLSINLPPLDEVIEKNRKIVQKFAVSALPVLQVWCAKNNKELPYPWSQGEVQEIVRHLENKGLLDFQTIASVNIPDLCRQASCWPADMPKTLDERHLKLDRSDIEEKKNQHNRKREEKKNKRRTIVFANHPLDADDSMFAHDLKDIADKFLSEDSSWIDRSSKRRTRLDEFPDSERPYTTLGTRGNERPGQRYNQQLTDEKRQAMGLLSEWLAYQFLSRRHNDCFNETCWVSGNRSEFLGGELGNDAEGYDFLVETPQANWMYEVKSSLEDSFEFELTANELSVASSASSDRRLRYRILYVPHVFSPEKWYVLELPNPMGKTTRSKFKAIGRGSVRFQFKPSDKSDQLKK